MLLASAPLLFSGNASAQEPCAPEWLPSDGLPPEPSAAAASTAAFQSVTDEPLAGKVDPCRTSHSVDCATAPSVRHAGLPLTGGHEVRSTFAEGIDHNIVQTMAQPRWDALKRACSFAEIDSCMT